MTWKAPFRTARHMCGSAARCSESDTRWGSLAAGTETTSVLFPCDLRMRRGARVNREVTARRSAWCRCIGGVHARTVDGRGARATRRTEGRGHGCAAQGGRLARTGRGRGRRPCATTTATRAGQRRRGLPRVALPVAPVRRRVRRRRGRGRGGAGGAAGAVDAAPRLAEPPREPARRRAAEHGRARERRRARSERSSVRSITRSSVRRRVRRGQLPHPRQPRAGAAGAVARAGRRRRGGAALPDHDAAPDHLPRGAHDRRALPGRRSGDHQPHRNG